MLGPKAGIYLTVYQCLLYFKLQVDASDVGPKGQNGLRLLVIVYQCLLYFKLQVDAAMLGPKARRSAFVCLYLQNIGRIQRGASNVCTFSC